MNRAGLIIVTAAAAVVLSGCVGSTPIPQETTTGGATATTASPTPSTPAVSSCDRVREAFLTGTKAEIEAALRALVADRSADGTAREYAGYYLKRDRNSADLREMDQSLISTSCSL